MRKIKFENFVWIDINQNLEDDIEILNGIMNIDESTETFLRSPIHLQRLEEFPKYMAVVLKYPLYDKDKRKNWAIELDIIMKEGIFVTAHSEELFFLNDIFNNLNNHNLNFKSPISLYLHIIENMLHSCLTPLNRIAEKIDFIEEEIFRGKERDMISEISVIKRDVLDFRKILRLHKSTIDSSLKVAPRYFESDLDVDNKQVYDISSINIHIWNITENLKESIEAFDDTNQTLLSYKLNQNIKAMTFFSTTIAPAALFVSLMNMNSVPNILKTQYSFYFVLFSIFLLTYGLYLYFKKKEII